MAVLTAEEARNIRRREDLAARAYASAFAGGIAWLIFVGATHLSYLAKPWELIEIPELIDMLFLLGPLVIVPLGFRVIALHSRELPPEPLRYAAALQFPCALLLLVAYSAMKSDVAMFFTLPWLLVTCLCALAGLQRFRQRGMTLRNTGELAFDSALVFIIVGGTWAAIARFGYRPLDLDEQIVQLTANHFHFAGFALLIIAGCGQASLPSRLGFAGVWGVITGVPLLAAGISSKAIAFEAPAAFYMALASILVSLLQVELAWRDKSVLRLLSGLSLMVSMGFAFAYAYGNLANAPWKLDIPTMAKWHGTLNALGFALCGLIGWGLEKERTSTANVVSG